MANQCVYCIIYFNNIIKCYLWFDIKLLQIATLVFEMAWNMSKDNLDMVWWAIVGSTEHSVLSKVESSVTVLEEGSLQAHVSRLTHRQGVDIDKQQQQHSIAKITYDKEYPFITITCLIYFIRETLF